MARLRDKIAVVTGASRGAGRGIALALGDEGATVYVTGRSVRGGSTTDGVPGTIEDTAEEVDRRGGRGIAVRCDHAAEAEVASLFERVRAEQARLDVLVANAWGGYEQYDGRAFGAPLWEQPFEQRWQGMFVAGLRAQLLACRHAVPLMLPARSGLVVSTVAWDRGKYLGALFYDVAKQAIRRAAYGLAVELRPHGIASIALAPGFVRTERVLSTPPDKAPEGVLDLSKTESPEYVGRAVASLAADPDVMSRTGGIFLSGELAEAYGFTDVDGRRVPPFRLPDEYLKD